MISLSSVTKFGNGVTKYSNAENHHITLNDENQQINAQNQSLGREFPHVSILLDPRPFPYQGNALPGWATKAQGNDIKLDSRKSEASWDNINEDLI